MTLEEAEFASNSAKENKSYESEKENFGNQIKVSIEYAFSDDYDITNMKSID